MGEFSYKSLLSSPIIFLLFQPPAQDQAKPIKLGLASFEAEACRSDCDFWELLCRSWSPQV